MAVFLWVIVLLSASTSSLAYSRVLREGMQGDDVLQLQKALAAAGFSPGPIDGIFGQQTKQAVMALQKKYALTVDGIAGAQTFSQLDKLKDMGSAYIVAPGDSLFKIAQRFGVTVEALRSTNRLSGDLIYPGQKLMIPEKISSQPEPSRGNHRDDIPTSPIVLGYFPEYYDGDNLAWNSLQRNYPYLTAIAPFSFGVRSNGTLSGKHFADAADFARQQNKQNLVLIHNLDDFNTAGSLAHTVLADQIRGKLVKNIVDLVKKYGYDGVNIDFEFVYPEDRERYTSFIRELKAQMPENKLTTVSIPAKTWDDPNNGWSGGYDYKAIGQQADLVAIMAYDEHWFGGSPGPIASIGWVKQVIQYAAALIPQQKILLGIATYGYDWASTGNKALDIPGAYRKAWQYGVKIQWHDTYAAPYYTYTAGKVPHTVWFENATSIGTKLDLVKTYGLGGIAMWRLGFEDSDTWKVIREKLAM